MFRACNVFMLVVITVLVSGYYCNVAGYTGSPGEHYIVGKFVQGVDSLSIFENDIIKGEADTVLTPVSSIEGVTCRPGNLLVRKKMAGGQYRLCSGLLDTNAFHGDFPLYVFKFPRWARLEDMVQYRMYRSPTERIGEDEPIVYFDNERLYSRTSSQFHYFRNGVWFNLLGTLKTPFGSLSVTSNPPGADVVLNGRATSKKTPCTFTRLIGGQYSVELFSKEYQFFGRTVRVLPDSGIAASFELIADVDTVFITGDVPYSLLLLPQPPLDKPYVIDDSLTLYGTRIRIAPGEHTIRWSDDDSRYVSLDTQITIAENRVLYFDYLFKLRYGILRLVPTPFDADVCIDKFGCSRGERVEELPVGIYRVDVYRQGFTAINVDIHVYPDTVVTQEVDLRQIPDSDGDGYPDSVDHCPDEYGLYSGCTVPKLQPIVASLMSELLAFVRNDRFTTGVSLIGFVSKTPTNRAFREFISVFSDGKMGGVNNYKGLTALNSIECTWRGLYLNADLGQWSSGIRYRRTDTLFVEDDKFFYFDSLYNIEPVLYIPSTSVSFGAHYNRSWLNISYSVGYQWEDIIIHQLYDDYEQKFVTLRFDNDWWYHQLGLDIDFKGGDQYIPSLYLRMRYPFGKIQQTRWAVLNAGFQLKISTGEDTE